MVTADVRFYGLLDHDFAEVIEFYPSREAAERELVEILEGEPDWVEKRELVEILEGEPDWVEKREVVVVDLSGAEVAVVRVPTP